MRALVVDDEKNIRNTIAFGLERTGWRVTTAATAAAALDSVAREIHELAVVDLRLGGENGLDLVSRLLAAAPGVAIIVVTAYASPETAVEAMKRGAFDYLPKPFTPAQLQQVVDRVAARLAAERRAAEAERRLGEAVPEEEFETASPRMRAVLEVVDRAAPSDVTVLLRGENGTGKNVMARRLHARSRRSSRAFISVACPTLSEELLASELFGHARGAFTGAVRDQPGKVEAAEGGTLFLDEISEVAVGLQAQLLRFLQERQFERLGETRTRTADVRVIAATNRDLETEVREGRFREDLLYRLNVVEITAPPLRERPEDILPLARRFLAHAARSAARRTPELSKPAEELLLAWPWPGNVRELRNVIERAVILWPADRIEPAAFPERMLAQAPGLPRLGGPYTLEEIEREHVLRVVASTPTLEEAARILGIDSSTLWRKRKRYETGHEPSAGSVAGEAPPE